MSRNTITQKELSEMVQEGHDLYNQRKDLMDRVRSKRPSEWEDYDKDFDNLQEAMFAWREVAGPIFAGISNDAREEIIKSAVCKEESDFILLSVYTYRNPDKQTLIEILE